MIYFFRPGMRVPYWLALIYVTVRGISMPQPAAFSGWGLIWRYRGRYHTFILWGSFIHITRRNNGLVHVWLFSVATVTFAFWPATPIYRNPWELTK